MATLNQSHDSLSPVTALIQRNNLRRAAEHRSAKRVSDRPELLPRPLSRGSRSAPKHESSTLEPGFITVAATPYPPYSLIDSDGVLVGIDGDVLAEIAKMECIKVKPLVASGGTGV